MSRPKTIQDGKKVTFYLSEEHLLMLELISLYDEVDNSESIRRMIESLYNATVDDCDEYQLCIYPNRK